MRISRGRSLPSRDPSGTTWCPPSSPVVDSDNRTVAIIETTSVEVVRLGDVEVSHAIDEGEGHTSVAEWRAGHESFWHSDELRRELGDPIFTVNDNTPVVLERFRVIERLNDDAA